MIRVQVEVAVYATESQDKIRIALSNIIFGMSFSERVEGQVKYLEGAADGLDSLSQIQRHLKDQAISAFARKILLKSITDQTHLRFYLNKQAAFMGVVHFCEKQSESPLGPITVEIQSDEVKSVIDYITGQLE
jgi:hypothetical protein